MLAYSLLLVILLGSALAQGILLQCTLVVFVGALGQALRGYACAGIHGTGTGGLFRALQGGSAVRAFQKATLRSRHCWGIAGAGYYRDQKQTCQLKIYESTPWVGNKEFEQDLFQ